MAVESVLIINNYGKPRLATFYRPIPTARQQLLIRTIFKLVSGRPDGELCNFLDAPELSPLLPSLDRMPGQPGSASAASKGKSKAAAGGRGAGSLSGTQQELRVIYRHYATLWFVFVVDQSESELGILDLIQVFVESLDRFFPNVCELDLIFHYEEVNAILAEIIQGGLVLETNINEIVKQAQITAKARKESAGAPPPGRIHTGTGFDVGLNAASAAAETLGGWARDWMSRR